MRNVYKVIVFFIVIVISQQEITTIKPPNTSVQQEEFTSTQTIEIASSFHPKPDILPQSTGSVPSNSSREILVTTTEDYVKPQTVLEYKPLKPFHQPLPVVPEQHKTVKPTKPSIQTLPLDLVERFPELTTLNKRISTPKEQETTTNKYIKPATVLSYKPITSFHHPHPITPAQIVPPGKPWPASAEGYETTKASLPETTLLPELVSRKTTKSPQSKKTKPSRKTTTFIVEHEPTTEVVEPITSFHQSNPATVAQIIPPGKPWPGSAEAYPTTNVPSPTTILEDTVSQWISNKTTTEKMPPAVVTDKTTKFVESQTVLEYKPITSFFHPHPVTVAQLIPPGKPWPASAEENKTNPPTVQTLPPDLISRFPELTTKTTTYKPTTTSSSTRLILTYKPQRPWYYPRPSTIGQLIPPGKPWPASPSEYPSFSVTTHPPWLKESVAGNNELEYYKPDELQQLKDESSLEPNALQYYGASVTAPPRYNNAMTPFTSGTQKTTISDIVDILKEVHNITLVSGNAAPVPSHLLPFDVDNSSAKGAPVVRRPPSQEYRQRQENKPLVQVYDGASSLEGTGNRERIFSNPKVVPQY